MLSSTEISTLKHHVSRLEVSKNRHETRVHLLNLRSKINILLSVIEPSAQVKEYLECFTCGAYFPAGEDCDCGNRVGVGVGFSDLAEFYADLDDWLELL